MLDKVKVLHKDQFNYHKDRFHKHIIIIILLLNIINQDINNTRNQLETEIISKIDSKEL